MCLHLLSGHTSDAWISPALCGGTQWGNQPEGRGGYWPNHGSSKPASKHWLRYSPTFVQSPRLLFKWCSSQIFLYKPNLLVQAKLNIFSEPISFYYLLKSTQSYCSAQFFKVKCFKNFLTSIYKAARTTLLDLHCILSHLLCAFELNF